MVSLQIQGIILGIWGTHGMKSTEVEDLSPKSNLQYLCLVRTCPWQCFQDTSWERFLAVGDCKVRMVPNNRISSPGCPGLSFTSAQNPFLVLDMTLLRQMSSLNSWLAAQSRVSLFAWRNSFLLAFWDLVNHSKLHNVIQLNLKMNISKCLLHSK